MGTAAVFWVSQGVDAAVPIIIRRPSRQLYEKPSEKGFRFTASHGD